MKFSPSDLTQIEERGLTPQKVLNQIEVFKKEIRFVDIQQPATIGDGITLLNDQEEAALEALYNHQKANKQLVKFTPASGAATRMFKFLFNFLEEFKPGKESVNAYINKHQDNNLRLFFTGLDKFPFYEKVTKYMRDVLKLNPEMMGMDAFVHTFVTVMLDEKHLDFGNTPKGLLPFHQYRQHTSTPLTEHLFAATKYLCNEGVAHLHFTISPQHQDLFKAKQQEVVKVIEKEANCTFEISYSFQESYTDTISVDTKNRPIRDENGALIFRPGGHGSLIENLNQIDADIIFIKNIDNVVVNSYEERVVRFKKILGGKLLELQERIHHYVQRLHEAPQDVDILGIVEFMQESLNIRMKEEFEKFSEKYQVEYLLEKLDRPLRVCGMVKNENEPGGGPFWVKHENGYVSLQIVESAQIDKKNEQQKKVFQSATHFNPVDIVCGVKDYTGKKYNLKKFVDKKAYFIASKSKSGKKIKALERPGLWNGGMAFWNTVFVEVPLYTFNPVKTVNDLLKPTHQKKL